MRKKTTEPPVKNQESQWQAATTHTNGVAIVYFLLLVLNMICLGLLIRINVAKTPNYIQAIYRPTNIV